jgi:hypothetical protein
MSYGSYRPAPDRNVFVPESFEIVRLMRGPNGNAQLLNLRDKSYL